VVALGFDVAAGGGVVTDTGAFGVSTGVIGGRLPVLYCDADTYLLYASTLDAWVA
jgi:hypothetical protein